MILDGNGNEISSIALAAAPGNDKPFQLPIECLDGYSLWATSPDAGVVIWAKDSPGGTFQNIQTTPIDLSPFANTIRMFYFECRIDSGEPAEQLIPEINVSRL